LNDPELYDEWLQNEGAETEVEASESKPSSLRSEAEASEPLPFTLDLNVLSESIKPKDKPVLAWTDTEILSFEPRTLPVETVPNAVVPLNQRLDLKDKFGVTDFMKKLNTKGYKSNEDLLNDLLRLCFKINTVKEWMLKRPVPYTSSSGLASQYVPISEEELFKQLNAGGKSKVRALIKANRYMFMCQGLTFNSSIPGYKNVFEGWNYEVLTDPDNDLIRLYLQHTKLYICENNDIIYNYLLSWIAFIIQNPGKKTLTAPVLAGPQGCGKNTFVNPLLKLMAPYSKLIDKIGELTGKFNGVLENLVFAVVNECKGDKKSKVDHNCLKGIITEDEVRIEAKHKDIRQAENVANFIFMSNNLTPFKQDVDDRRHLDLQCAKPEDPSWFDDLYKEIEHPLFIQTLFTYLMNYKIDGGFDFVKQLPMTALKEVIRSTYKNPFEMFITKHYQEFVDGWDSKDCRATAEREIIAKTEGDEWKEYKKKGLTLDLMKYCGKAVQRRIKGTTDKEYAYKLLPNYVQVFKPTEEEIASGEFRAYLDEESASAIV
jgi:energy-coupling factor transporter ATP-binding protein EcfA2